jgi:tRNA(Ile)-lysidine synthase TilS/MesJ
VDVRFADTREAGMRSDIPICVVTSHGRQVLTARPGERVIDVLTRCQVPWSGVSIYAVPRTGGPSRLSACLDKQPGELEDVAELQVFLNRNVNPFLFSLNAALTLDSAGSAPAVTEYIYQRLDSDASSPESYLRKLSSVECRQIIVDRVADCIRDSVPTGGTLVVGVSGGGDSNALLYALSHLTGHTITIDPVILKGIPDWDQGVPRAEAMCASYDLPLTVLEEEDVAELLRIPSDSTPLIERFERAFPGDDFEFLGTLLIRLALARRAREVGTPYICTGLNLEDVVCEALFRVSSGMQPAPMPVRPIGDVSLILPLWRCPKRIIDGCFPTYSLQNYKARYPCFSLGRNMYYSVVYAMQSQFPGFLEQLAAGFSELAKAQPVSYTYDSQLGFHIERQVSLPLRRAFERMLGRNGTVR